MIEVDRIADMLKLCFLLFMLDMINAFYMLNPKSVFIDKIKESQRKYSPFNPVIFNVETLSVCLLKIMSVLHYNQF